MPFWAVALGTLVACSTVLHWLAGRRLHGLWIMPDEAIYAERALTLWRHGSLPLLHGEGAGNSVLYPILAGFPLSVASLHSGYAALKVVQALVVSLAAVPVTLYGRRIMPRGYALTAAALTVASPLLLYSGLVMTEVLFYPLAALALLTVARAVATGSHRDQGLALALMVAAVLTRVQAVVLVGVLALSVVLDALLRRDLRRLRTFWPTWLALGATTAAAAVTPGLFGSYAGTLRGSYPVGAALGLTFDHLSYVVLSTGIVPSLALVLLALDALRGREHDPYARALIVVTLCSVALVVVQVGLFAARYSPHLLGRDLAALPPLLFLTFALWLARGSPRSVVSGAVASFGLLCVLLLAPWNHLVASNALPDTFGIDALYRLHGTKPADAVAVASLLVVVLALALPRRLVPVLAGVVAAALVVSSVAASNDIVPLVDKAQAQLVGSPADWIDRAVTAPVAYLYDGETYWNSVWEQRFWNERLEHVYTVAPSTIPGPLPQTEIRIGRGGRVPLAERYVVAANTHVFVGTPIAQMPLTGSDVSGLTLWRLDRPPRLSLVEHGVQPNGDMTGPARIAVYDCRGGTLELTLLPKETRVLEIDLDGRPVLTQQIAREPAWHGAIPVPRSYPRRDCVFEIRGQTLLGSTRIAFVR